jgi:CheY-like chemotaxis protein
MKDLLIAGGFEVDSAQGIEEACLNFYEDLFDIIFVDLRLPGVSEAEGIRFLKQNIKSAHSPIIVTTAYSEKELVLDCINEGISDYLIKPITRGKLMPRVASILGIHWEEKI